jgi:hypothetical protein
MKFNGWRHTSNFYWQKTMGYVFVAAIACASLIGFYSFIGSRIVTFESIQSLNQHETPVLNQIMFRTNGDHDVWQMRQSHTLQQSSGQLNEFDAADQAFPRNQVVKV